MRRGHTLIEMMIVVAMLGICLSGAWSLWGTFDAPGRPGHTAVRQDEATLALMNARQAALAAPVPNSAAPVSLSAPPGMTLTRQAVLLRPGVQRIDWVLTWRGFKDRLQVQRLSALKAVPR